MALLFASTQPVTPTGVGGLGTLAAALLISGAALVLVWAMLRARDALARRRGGAGATGTADRPPAFLAWLGSMAGGRRPSSAGPRGVETDLASVARDVEELAEHLAARMDDRAQRLEELIAIADDRLARLGAATGGDAPQRAAPRGATTAGPRSMRAALGRMIEEEHEDRSVGAAAPRQARSGGVLRADEPDPINHRVCQLADAGKDSAEIAAALDEPIGKVQLILALRDA